MILLTFLKPRGSVNSLLSISDIVCEGHSIRLLSSLSHSLQPPFVHGAQSTPPGLCLGGLRTLLPHTCSQEQPSKGLPFEILAKLLARQL